MLILYNPKSNRTGKAVLPMSLLALAAQLEGARKYRIVDGNVERLDASDAHTVAMTVMPGPQLVDAYAQAKRIKRHRPNTTIVWGGYFPTLHPDACVDSPLVDYILKGHADETCGPFLEALDTANQADLRSIPGLAYRRHDGSVHQAPEPPLPDPNALPDYPYHRVAMERYVRPTFMGRRTIPHHSSYGCPFTCNFCGVVNLASGRWRAQTAARTAGVVRHLVERFGVDSVEFYDSNFFVSEERTREFCERTMDLRIGWWGEGRIDTLWRYRSETWRLMRESGLRMVFLGAESGSDEMLARMNKGGSVTVEKTVELVRRMRDVGVVPELSFIVGNPPEPRADFESTLQFVRRLKQVNPACEIVLYPYTPVPLTGELYDEAQSGGFAFPETLDEWTSRRWRAFSERTDASVPWVDRSLRRRILDFERVLNAYYPTTTDVKLRGPVRFLLRAISAWRYHLGVYRFPFELRAVHKWIAYQRPETSGF